MVRLVPMMADFPSFSEGLSLRLEPDQFNLVFNAVFPFLFGRAFIEASTARFTLSSEAYFPSFSEGLSLRLSQHPITGTADKEFPFLFGRAFIEAWGAGVVSEGV